MVAYVNKTKWKKMKKNYKKFKETYRYDPIAETVCVLKYYHRDRLNPMNPSRTNDVVCDSQNMSNI